MKTIQGLLQGSDAWLAHRRTTHSASDAPAMMGASPYVNRSDLIRQRATGVAREIDDATQRVFDRGHEIEPALRALAEKIIGEDLYPVTGVSDDGYLGASFDGVTMLEDTIFEAKQHNADKRACIYDGNIPPADYWQIVQQFAVCTTATQCLYLCGDGTEENTAQLWIERARVEADIPKLIAGWTQFDADVAAHQPEPAAAPVAVGRAPDQLPSLHIEVTGMVTASNLREFQEQAMAVLGGINRDLQTDDDFANAEQTVKWCKAVEERLDAAKAHALGQTASIDELFRTIDSVSAEARKIRLELDKLVTREKENRKAEIVRAAVSGVNAHIASINATLGEHALPAPSTLQAVIGAAIKGKRTLSSIKDAADSAAAQAKIDASQRAERTRACIAVLAEFPEHAALFADRVQLCATKAPEDLRNLAKARVAEHDEREAERLERERERIRQEESQRLERERAAAELAAAKQEPDGADLSPPAQQLHEAEGAQRFAEHHPKVAAAPAPAPAALASTARIKLGDINAAIAPLSITADGLASLGFKPVASRGAAKLYAASDFHRICSSLARVIDTASARGASEFSEAA